MAADQPTDQFKGAEASIDSQKMDALNALATLGRRGLQAAVDHRNGINDGTGMAPVYAPVPDHGRVNAADFVRAGGQAYNQDAQRAVAFLGDENAALQTVNANYYDQARQAVPLLRTNAASVIDQYRKNYEERQAQVEQQRALLEEQRQQALMQLQLQRDALAQQAAISAAQIAGYGAGGGAGGSGTGVFTPIPAPTQPSLADLNAAANQALLTGNQPAPANKPRNPYLRKF